MLSAQPVAAIYIFLEATRRSYKCSLLRSERKSMIVPYMHMSYCRLNCISERLAMLTVCSHNVYGRKPFKP